MPIMSNDGGYEFNAYDRGSFVNAKASASRTDISLSSEEVIGWGDILLT